jgi:hypothetical protein
VSGDPYIVIATPVFSGVTQVRLYEETVVHITEEHPEVPILLPSIYEAVKQTIVNPTHIEVSATRANSFVFVDAQTTDAVGGPLRIPVRLVEGTSGRITTAYFAEVTGERDIVWRRS